MDNQTYPGIPAALHAVLEKSLERLSHQESWPAIIGRDAKLAQTLNRVLACSDYVAGVLVRYPNLLGQLIEDGRMHRTLERGELEPIFLEGAADGESDDQFMRRLRLFRHRELTRIIWRDLAGWSDCPATLAELSALADTCIRAAFLRASSEMESRYGLPVAESGELARFVIIAMGKLGGGELNLSSDVDVIFLYSEHGETDGARSLENEDYFRRLAQHLIGLLSKKTVDGFVYRVDARLRPFGDSGPLACSSDAFEDYLLQHGRDWERYAWVKARAVNVWEGTRDFYTNVLRPFVYRRYLDFGVFASLREMKAMIEREGRAAENRENVKLGPGGIREIEFIVQTLQLVRGGTVRSLRQRSLWTALQNLGEEGLMPAKTVAELGTAYYFLRDVENRIQAIADRQTHELPVNDIDRARLCLSMGYANWEEFYAALNEQRTIVQADFDEILRHDRSGEGDEEPAGETNAILQNIAEQVFAKPEEAMERLDGLLGSSLYQRMDKVGKQRLNRLLPTMLLACGGAGNSMLALDGMLRLIESIGRRSAYIALLNENDAALERVVHLCGSSEFLARQVAAHPLLLDELLDPRVFLDAPTRAGLEADIRHRMGLIESDDTEQQFEALRNFQQAAVFRVAVADLSGILPLMKVSDRLTDIAELVLAAALNMSVAELVAKHGRPRCVIDGVERHPGIAIAAYGKLGGLELGYGSDLDIVFIHDSAGEHQETDGDRPLDNSMFFGRVARRITHILTMPTPTGALYEVDTRLRPSGNSGLLVTSLVAFDNYQKEDAWTWEHQALLRSRAVAGSKDVRQEFEKLRMHALVEYVRRDSLRDEVIKMRSRMRAELDKTNADQFDIKQGVGGVIDIEFLVQFLVLLNAPAHPALLEYSDNIRQLDALRDAEILTAEEAEAMADAYRSYRIRMHALSLAGENRLVSAEDFKEERLLVSTLWARHLGEPI
ncbi:MAG: bifunctional [glutamate--ammonia ligase]-adenylyl-L-tyrosine phosphorylase/[glutamate--ammonia-ligase] adenylyltransferase [Gammaproteobacteria bacterium]|jgi:glutamate-ammonia-ligase adenylyltransferase